MDYKIIQDIINLDHVSAEEKLSMIERVAKRFEEIDDYATSLAESEGRETTFDDEYLATEKFAADAGVDFDKSDEEIKKIIKSGLMYLMNQQTESGGWGHSRRERIPTRIHDLLRADNFGAVPSAWVTVMALSNLISYQRFFDEALDIRESGNRAIDWLMRNQDSNGAWRDVELSWCESPTNVIQTGMAITGLVYGGLVFEQADPSPNIEAGLEFLAKSQDRETGGWSSLPGELSDSKATSMAVIASLFTNKLELAKRGIDWLLTTQNKAGDWGYVRTTDSFLFGAYYGIEALEMYRIFDNAYLSTDHEYSLQVDRAIRRCLNWYVKTNRLIRLEGEYRWGWKNGDKIADVANTAAAIIVLLDCAEDDFSFVINKGVEYLLSEKHQDNHWKGDTSMVLTALIRYIKPESRLHFSMPQLADILKEKVHASR